MKFNASDSNIKSITTVYLIYIALLSFLSIPIERLLNRFIVKLLFTHFQVTIFNEILLIILAFLFTRWASKNIAFETLLKASIACFIFYLFQRLSDSWIFYNISFSNILKIWDFPLISLVTATILSGIRRKPVAEKLFPEDQGFLEDNPITTDEEDSFNRGIMAKQIASHILKTKNQKSFAIGVLGEYGSGKTSFLRLIVNKMDKSKVEIVHFNPWSSENASNIPKDFFDVLSEKVVSLNSNLSSLIYSYSRKLRRVDDVSNSLVNRLGFIDSIYSRSSQSTAHEQINKMINATGKKIIVVIDDLDRLYNDEIMEVLRLIRNTADFSNVFYLVAYDKAYVLEAIKTLNRKGNATYLDKIFQLEIPLPKREVDDLINILIEHINKDINELDLESFEERIIHYGIKNPYEHSYGKVFRNFRDIVKFVNGFRIAYNLLRGEVDFENLFLLELIKFRFPAVYDLLYEYSDNFLYLKYSGASHQEYYCIRYHDKQTGDNKRTTQLYKHLTDLGDLNSFDIELIDVMFRRLFSADEYSLPRVQNAISYPLFYQIYFKYRISAYDLSEKEFSYAIKSGGKELYKFISTCVSKGLHKSILTRLLQEKPKDKRSFKTLISTLFYLGPKYVAKTSSTSFNYQELRYLILDYRGSVIDTFFDGDKESYKRFISNFFSTAQPTFLFENQLIYDIKHHNDDFIIPVNELVDYQVGYFKTYIDAYGLDKNAVWMLYGIRHEYTEPAPEPGMVYSKWHFEEKVILILKNHIKNKDPKYFLIDSIKTEIHDRALVGIVPQIIDMFENPNELKGIIEQNPVLDEKIRSEYLVFFDKCAEVSFSHYVKFNFQTELKPKSNN